MKNINMKKVVAGVAALGVSALLAGSVVAANVGADNFSMNITKDTMYNNGVPAVSVVVGSMAQPVDVVWAGNIAAAIGKKAYTTTGTVGGASLQDVTIEVGSSSTSTISGDGYLSDNYTLNDMTNTAKVIDETDYSMLYKTDTSADSDHAGASTLTISDELSVTANVYFNKDKDVKDLVASIDKGAISYSVDFDEGIKGDYTDAGASPRLKFNLMGKNYTVDSFDGTTLKLVQNLATQTYAPGASFTADDYTIEVVNILDTGDTTNRYQAEMNLKDSTGSVVATDVFRTGDTKIFDSYLESNIDVDTVYATTVKVITGSSGKLELKNGSKITDFPNKDDKLWKVDFTPSAPGASGYLTKITLSTDDTSLRFTNDDSLRVGDSVELPLGFGSIDFLGLTEEKSAEFYAQDNYIYFTDADRKDHEVFMYDYDEATTARDSYTSLLLDGKELYFKFYTAAANDVNFTVQLEDSDGKYLTGADGSTPTWVSTTPDYYSKSGSVQDVNTGLYTNLRIPLYNNDARDVEYTVMVAPGVAKTASADAVYNTIKTVAMGLKNNQTVDLGIGDTGYTWDVSGIDSTNTAAGFISDASFIGDRVDSATFTDNYANDDFESIAAITVTNGSDSITMYMDAYTGDMVNLNDNDFLGTYKQVYGANGSDTFDLSDKGNDSDLVFGYTTYGAYATIEDGYPMFTLPEKQLKGQIFIGGGVSSETTLNGGELVLTTPGTVVETEDGMISAKLITSTVTGGEEMTAMTPANWNASTQRIVYLDNETMTSAGAKIIVGGHLVNSLASGITDEFLTEAGQFVVGSVENGNIVVAGFSAADTADAAKELINAIEMLD